MKGSRKQGGTLHRTSVRIVHNFIEKVSAQEKAVHPAWRELGCQNKQKTTTGQTNHE